MLSLRERLSVVNLYEELGQLPSGRGAGRLRPQDREGVARARA